LLLWQPNRHVEAGIVAQTVVPAKQTKVEIARWAISVADYHRIHEAGILGEDDRVELIDGEVRVMSPISTIHAGIVRRYIALFAHVGQTAIVSVHNPVELNT